MTETEPEFDANERDSWYALREFEEDLCPHCGNLKVICSDPGGITGNGYHLVQGVCYVTAIKDSTVRRIRNKFEKATAGLDGMLPTDGVTVRVSLVDEPSEDVLGLEAPPKNPGIPPPT